MLTWSSAPLAGVLAASTPGSDDDAPRASPKEPDSILTCQYNEGVGDEEQP